MYKFSMTLGWVWGVCFLAIWGIVAFIKVAERQTEITGWWLGAVSLLISLPIAVAVTTGLRHFRKSIAGTELEGKLAKAKGLRVLTVSVLVGFGGAAEVVAFGTGLGEVVFFLAWIGGIVGLGINLYEILKDYRA
jgi:hypothetical protein